MSDKSQGVVSGYLQQQLLIAMPSMEDPNFSRSVTLLCQHNEEGAIGITINRQSDFSIGELLFQLNIPCTNQAISSMTVLEGGPVSPDHGFVVHTSFDGFDSSIRINDDIMVTTSRDVLSAIASDTGPRQFLVALGYAGWDAGQLEFEMLNNAWLTVPASPDVVFDIPFADRWSAAAQSIGIDISKMSPHAGHA